jgi:phenylalanine-4-hydroxylase
VREDGDLRIYGSGIVSSHGETRFALDDPSPNRIGFDLRRVMRTRYRIDDYQQTYFVIPDFDTLLRATQETDFAPLYAELEGLADLQPDVIAEGDMIVTLGTQDHALSRTSFAPPA